MEARITPAQYEILWLLMCHPRVDREMMVEALWPHPDFQPDWWYSTMVRQIHLLRQALIPFGWNIQNTTRWGWTLTKTEAVSQAA